MTHSTTCHCRPCLIERTELAGDAELASRIRARMEAAKAGEKPVFKRIRPEKEAKPVEYRRGRDGTLKRVVSKGCKGCHNKRR